MFFYSAVNCRFSVLIYYSLYYITIYFIFQLDPTIYESIQKEKVEVGDVIYIEANTGSVKVNLNYIINLASV